MKRQSTHEEPTTTTRTRVRSCRPARPAASGEGPGADGGGAVLRPPACAPSSRSNRRRGRCPCREVQEFMTAKGTNTMPNSSAPVVRVERRRSATAAPHGLKRSSWFILVNSNKRRAQLSPEGEANFAAAVEGFTRNLPRFVRFTAGDGASWTKDHIKSVSINYALEKGESAGSLHASEA